MKTTHAILAATLAATTCLHGCASPYQQQQTSSPTYPATSSSYATYYGVVDSIQLTTASNPDTSIGAGTVIGGVVGGLLGSQVGGGDGKKAATVAGAVGGAVVGHQIEKSNREQPRNMYQISVRLDNGSHQTVVQDSIGDLQVGNRVRIENGRAYRY